MEISKDTQQMMEEYRKAVTALADTKENRRFLNDSCEHAKDLANLMVGRAQSDDESLIYSGELGKGCFNDALTTSKGKIRILLDDRKGIAVVKSLPKGVQDRIEVRIVEQQPRGNHFFVSGQSFRYETDHVDSTAVANFNEPDTVEKLTLLFDDMWGQAIGV